MSNAAATEPPDESEGVMADYLHLERDGGVATLTIDRPHVRNAIPGGGWDALHNGNPSIPFTLEFTDPTHLGLNAMFRIRQSVNVHDSDPVDINRVAFERKFVIAERHCSIDVPSSSIPKFGYVGSKIDISCQAEVVVDDAIFFDSKERQEVRLKRLTLNNDGLVANPSAEMNPRDEIKFFAILPS